MGYYIPKEGIQPSRNKITDFKEVTSPHTLISAQGLNDELTTMSHFISNSVEKVMPLFDALKGSIKKNNISWTIEDEAAQHQINKLLHKLPTLASPIPG